VAIAAGFTKLPPTAFETWLFTRKDYFRDPNGMIDVKALQLTFDVQKDLGFLKTNIDAQRFVDLSLIEEAGKRLK
jgi:NitT/TauT family transport system substrate-binding protein